MEVDHGDAVEDHALEHPRDDVLVQRVDPQPGSAFGLGLDFHMRGGQRPLLENDGVTSDGHIDQRFGGFATAFQGLGIAMVDDGTVVDEEEGVAHFIQLTEDVRADEDGLSFFGKEADELLQLDAGLRIQPGGRLVHDEDLGIMQKGAPKTETLCLAFRELIAHPIRQRREIGEIHHFLNPLQSFLTPVAERPGVKVEILEHGHVLIRPKAVRHPAEEATHLRGVVHHIVTADGDLAARRIVQRGQNAHRGGFPRAIRTDKAHDLAVIDGEGDAVHRVQFSESTVKVLHHDGGLREVHFGGRIGSVHSRIEKTVYGCLTGPNTTT